MSPNNADGQIAQIVALSEAVAPEAFMLRGEICTLGRASTCELVVNNKIVSRLHAKIERVGPRYVLSDAGSANGTFVNERRLQEGHVLRDDDRIGLGSPAAVLRFIDPDSTVACADVLQFDEQSLQFSIGERRLELTPAQFRLLRYLYQHAGDICTRESCAEVLWGREFDQAVDSSALDQTIAGLRAKLRQIDPGKDFIQTRRGFGYILAT